MVACSNRARSTHGDKMKLKNKVAIITGGGSGIGKATAILFAKEGCKVVIADVNPKPGEEVERMIRNGGEEAFFIKTDVTNSSEVKRLMDKTIKKYSKLDILFNNAGTYFMKNFEEITEDDWDKTLDINLKGAFLCSKYALPLLKKTKGTIINNASGLGIKPEPGSIAYCASKAGLISLTRSMALEYSKIGIRVNCVCPGPILTPLLKKALPTKEDLDECASMMPMKRIGTSEEVAKVVLFLASDDASYVTGGIYTVDGGETA